MKCDEIKEQLWLYQTGELESSSADFIRVHLKECGKCRMELALLEKFFQRLPGKPKFSESDWDRYTARILNRLEERRSAVPLGSWRWAPAFALGLVLVFGGIFYRIHDRQKSDHKEIIARLDVLENLDLLERDDFEELAKAQ